MLTFRFTGADGVMTVTEILTSGMVGKEAKFEFSSDWENLRKTAVFMAGSTMRDVLNVTETVVIPSEVLIAGEYLHVGIYGVSEDGRKITPTIYARGPKIRPGADPSGDESTDPTLPVWAQLDQRVTDLEENGTGNGSSDSGHNDDYVTPQMYGAKADGVTDDTAAFTDAINSGKIVFIPQGDYLLEDLAIDKTCRILGEDRSNTKIKCRSITLNKSTEMANVTISAVDSTKTGVLVNSSSCNIHNCAISGFNIGLELAEDTHIVGGVYRNITISGCKHAGLKAVASAGGQKNVNLFEGLYFVSNGIAGDLSTGFENGFGMYIDGGINMEIRNCVFEWNSGVGLYIDHTYPIRGCIVTTPYFEWNKHANFYINNTRGTDFRNVHISGEYYTDAGHPLSANAVSNRGLCIARPLTGIDINYYSGYSEKWGSGYFNHYNPDNIFPFDDLADFVSIADTSDASFTEVDGETAYFIPANGEKSFIYRIMFALPAGNYRMEFDAKRAAAGSGYSVAYVRQYGKGGTAADKYYKSFQPVATEWKMFQWTFSVANDNEATVAFLNTDTVNAVYIRNIRIIPIADANNVDLTGYATEEYVDNKIAEAGVGGSVDLSGYAKTSDLPTKVSQLDNDKGYLTEHQDISGKLDADKLPEAIDDALAKAKASGEFDGPKGDKGDRGDTGATGPQGPQGEAGPAGSDASVTADNVKKALGYTPIGLPKNDSGAVVNGSAGQFAVSDGAGGITWLSLTNVAEEGA